MARRLTGIKDVEGLARAADSEITRLEIVAKSGVVAKNVRAGTGDSYFYMDSGVLKFFNATTKTSSTVTLG